MLFSWLLRCFAVLVKGRKMRKIEGHIHLVREMAGAKGQGRLSPLGNGYAIWDDGEIIKLIPDGWGDDNFLAEKYLQIMDEEEIERAVIL